MPRRVRPPRHHAPEEIELDLGLDEADDEVALRARLARRLRMPEDALPDYTLAKRSIDARGGTVRFHLMFAKREKDAPPLGTPFPRALDGGRPVIIVGDGPAGLFCAYELARRGVHSVVLDRGKPVQPRRMDLAGLQKEGRIDADSNYCFGEGGAGTYSDGKLYTRAHKRGDVRDVIETLAVHGAPERILVDARPHIGSNKLPKVITAIRERLEAVGVRFEFGARVVALRARAGRMVGVEVADGRFFEGDDVVVATGHSARDIFEMLVGLGAPIEPKAFALGVRIEHPQPLINRIQYGNAADHPKLPNAYYRIAHTVEERGVFSFCMCPGGWIVPASTEPEGLVVNGMSLSRRDSPFANSGLVVGVEPGDWEAAGFRGPLGGIELQRTIERAAFAAGTRGDEGPSLRAPATRVSDFVRGRASSTVPESSYIPGLAATDVREVLDVAGVPIAARLRDALDAFGRRMRGYVSDEAVLVATESRTSAPLRVIRESESCESPAVRGLYPCGEGAGYAGGIVSAAMDGMKVARAIAVRRL